MKNDSRPNETISQNEIHNRVLSLFKYIQELNKIKKKTVLNAKNERWLLWCSEIPDDPKNVKLFYQDRTEEDVSPSDEDENNTLFSVHKEDFSLCPNPPEELLPWLNDGWQDFRKEADHCDTLKFPDEAQDESKVSHEENEEEHLLNFDDDEIRVKSYTIWVQNREFWAAEQKRIARNRDLFDTLYAEYHAMKRDGEVEEVIVANGIFCDAENPSIFYPLLTRRTKLEFDPDSNVVSICDTAASPELYTDVLKSLDDVNLQEISELQDEMIDNDYHPLDRNNTPGFLKVLIRQLSSNSTYSNDGIPEGWNKGSRFLLCNAPCFIIRNRQDGTVRAIEKINEAILAGAPIPQTLVELVTGGKVELPPDEKEYSIEEQLAMVGGESPDILLSKETNREQLEIAQRIENYNAVLVQGPPGTGKTHTIANLLGHFIAQGKSVLVTSYTTKALDVLKEKINPGLQSLCVSLLDDSNKDMEASVDGITNYMSNHTSSGLKREIDDIDAERQNIITGLAKVRKQIFMSLQKECESIIYQGESFTPTEAAKFVALNQDRLDYIPGYVKKDAVLPLTFEELVELYRSNEIITEDDAEELDCDLPSPNDLLTADGFEEICDRISSLNRHIEEINTDPSLKVKISSESTAMQFEIAERKFSVENSSKEAIAKLKSYCEQYKTLTPWQQAVAVDGKAGSGYKNRWLNLVQQIENAQKIGAEFADKGLGMNVSFAEGVFVDDLLEPLKKVKGFYDNGGLPFMFSILHKTCAKALKAVRVSGKVPSSSRECEVVILRIEQIRARQLCAASWKELLQPYCVEDFYSFGAEPEREVQPYVQSIRMYLDWWEKDYQKFTALMENANLPEADVCGISSLDSSTDSLKKLLAAISHIIPICCDACATMFDLLECREKINQQAELLIKGNRVHSDILKGICEAMLQMNAEIYDKELEKLASVYKKRDILSRRDAYLKRLRPYAPDWAEAIHKHKGIHGEAVVRSDIMEAWKWRQLSMLLDEITSTPLREYQSESRRLSKAYRAITAKYAEKCGWYHLLLNTERDRGLQQALQGWRAAIRKVGKGTGKRAPIFKAEARRLMPKCQTAVPVWIMPIYKAMENLDSKKNNFDIVIVDEASQADISSLAILYMGKKLIIVGDDKQVSPMAVGVDTNKMDNLRQMYLSEDIPNSVQYDGKRLIIQCI